MCSLAFPQGVKINLCVLGREGGGVLAITCIKLVLSLIQTVFLILLLLISGLYVYDCIGLNVIS